MYAFPEPGPGPCLVRGPSPSQPGAVLFHTVPQARAWGHPNIQIPPSHPLNTCKQLRLCHPLASNAICPQQMVQKRSGRDLGLQGRKFLSARSLVQKPRGTSQGFQLVTFSWSPGFLTLREGMWSAEEWRGLSKVWGQGRGSRPGAWVSK